MLPPDGSRMQAMTLSSVVLPEPEGPRRATTSPGATSSEMSRSASMRVSPSPKCLEMPRRLTSALSGMGAVIGQLPSAVAGSALSAARTPSALASRQTRTTTPPSASTLSGSSTTRRGK